MIEFNKDTNILLSNRQIFSYNGKFLETRKKHSCAEDISYLEFRDIYPDVIELFDMFLKNVVDLAYQLGFYTSMDIANFYTFMIKNGFFSCDGIFQISRNGQNYSFPAFSIFNGYGACIEINDLLKHVMLASGYNATSIACKLEEVKRDYVPDIKTIRERVSYSRRIIEKIREMMLSNRHDPNHIITLIEEQNEFYLYDALNYLIYYPLNFRSAVIANSDIRVNLEPYISQDLFPRKEELVALEHLAFSDEIFWTYDFYEYVFSMEMVLEVMRKNSYLVKDFYDEVNPLVRVLASTKKRH